MSSAMYPDIKNKAVFVTGGASGIGAALVRAFVWQGARVGFVDIDEAASTTLVDSLGDASVWRRVVDVTDVDALQASVRDFAAASGGLDVLINNVANDARHDPWAVTPAQWRAALAVNLDAAFFATQTAMPFLKTGRGAVVTLGSINGLTGPAGMPAYVAAKSALIGLTKSLARDAGRDGVRVNAILPGWVDTPRQRDLWLTPEAEALWNARAALGRVITPEEIAASVMFLSSSAASAITGQSIVVDAGYV